MLMDENLFSQIFNLCDCMYFNFVRYDWTFQTIKLTSVKSVIIKSITSDWRCSLWVCISSLKRPIKWISIFLKVRLLLKKNIEAETFPQFYISRKWKVWTLRGPTVCPNPSKSNKRPAINNLYLWVWNDNAFSLVLTWGFFSIVFLSP